MEISKFKKIWKNKFFRAALQIAFSFAIVFGFIVSLRMALGVENPIFVVSSGSMFPTLNIGDIIVIQKVTPAQLNVGDIIVFRNPREPYGIPIVHRVMNIIEWNGGYNIITAGDATGIDRFSPWNASLLIGRVIMKIPYLGHLYLFLYSILNKNTFTATIIAVIVMLIILFFLIEGEDGKNIRKEMRKKNLVYIISLNALIIFLLFFSLWGHIRVWQPGADPPQWVIIPGMFEELRLNIVRYGNENVSLVVGFMTYKIDCQVDGNLRQGVLAFFWFQFLLLILLLLDMMKILVPILHSRKNKRTQLYTEG